MGTAINILKPMIVCTLCFELPYFASAVYPVISSSLVPEIQTRPLLMFFGGMAYMTWLKNAEAKRVKKGLWTPETQAMIDENLARGEELKASFEALKKGR